MSNYKVKKIVKNGDEYSFGGGGNLYADVVSVGGGAGSTIIYCALYNGAGGGGGVNYQNKHPLSSDSICVLVGDGGTYQCSPTCTNGWGGDSNFDGVIGYGGGNLCNSCGCKGKATGGSGRGGAFLQNSWEPTPNRWSNFGILPPNTAGGTSVYTSNCWATGGAGGAGGDGFPMKACNSCWSSYSCYYGGMGGIGKTSPLTKKIYGTGGNGASGYNGTYNCTIYWGNAGSGAHGSSSGTGCNGCKGIVEVGYPIDGSYGFNCATGGDIETRQVGYKIYKIHTFTSDGTFSVCGTCEVSPFVRVAVVGGGSGALCLSGTCNGYLGGGGGGGEVVLCMQKDVNIGSHSIKVGAGGPACSYGGSTEGGYSCAFNICARGGCSSTQTYRGANSGSGCTGGNGNGYSGGGGGGALGDGGNSTSCYGSNGGAPIDITEYASGLRENVLAGCGGRGGGCMANLVTTNPFADCYCYPGAGGYNGSCKGCNSLFDGNPGIVVISYTKDGSTGIHCATGGDCCWSNGIWCYHAFISDGTFTVVS